MNRPNYNASIIRFSRQGAQKVARRRQSDRFPGSWQTERVPFFMDLPSETKTLPRPKPDDVVKLSYVLESDYYADLLAELRLRADEFELSFEGEHLVWVMAPLRRHPEIAKEFSGRYSGWPHLAPQR